jgi:hypothetical protein
VSKFRNYGNLAHLDFEGMTSSVRINNDEYDKEQVADFALWKAYDKETDGENFWEITITVPEESINSVLEVPGENNMRFQNGSNSSENRAPE